METYERNNTTKQSQSQQQHAISISEKSNITTISTTTTTTTTSTTTSSGSVVCGKVKSDVPTKRPSPIKAANATGTGSTATTTITTTTTTMLTATGSGGGGGGVSAEHQRIITATLTAPSTPRIELSRASSSSHHEEDSRESSPENVFEQVGTGTLQESIGLGFREEGALELRSSTEELYFMDPDQKREEQEKQQMLEKQQQQQQHHQQHHHQQQHHQQHQHQQQQQQTKRSSPHIFKFDEHQTYLQQHQRKDSASSEVAALLCISGRTSRISSVGSQGSAVSRLSAVSGISRSPSPHRMLLETSFCGPKPVDSAIDSGGGGGGGGVGGSGGVEAATHMSSTASATELMEQALLARKHDPTQAVLAEGIRVESSPKRKPPPTSLSNGDAKLNAKLLARGVGGTTTATTTAAMQRRSAKSPGQMVVGKTPSGTEYIRINLKPDHMYTDKGIAPHERVVEAPNTLAPVYAKGQKKPGTLSIGRNMAIDDKNRLTPTASPKSARLGGGGSRSPSPATLSVSRKSSFSSLFRFGGGGGGSGGGKESPESPRERSRSRSKSRERQTQQTPQPHSQNVTPSKQKSVLGIFKTGKRGSSAGGGADSKTSKSNSPVIDAHELQQLQHSRSKSQTPVSHASGSTSRPASRLRYYDEPVEGVIHIPLHTPPEERETRKLLQGIQQLNAEPPVRSPVPPAEPPRIYATATTAATGITPATTTITTTAIVSMSQANGAVGGGQPTITASQLAAAAAALKPVGAARKEGGGGGSATGTPMMTTKSAAVAATKAAAAAENLDAISTLQLDDDNNTMKALSHHHQLQQRNWSIEVNRSSQDSQFSAGSEALGRMAHVAAHAAAAAAAKSAAAAAAAAEQQSNGVVEIHRLPSVESQQSAHEAASVVQTVAAVISAPPSQPQPMPHAPPDTTMPGDEDALARERRRLLFATRLGSGSQEQIFSTQFSISKTESISSQLSEQVAEAAGECADFLQRQDTVIRRIDVDGEREREFILATQQIGTSSGNSNTTTLKRKTSAQRQKSHSTSEDEKTLGHGQMHGSTITTTTTTVSAVVMRRKESSDEQHRKSTSEEEMAAATAASAAMADFAGGMANQRHSRYLEHFDVRKKPHENLPRKPKRQSTNEMQQQQQQQTMGDDELEDQEFTSPPPSSSSSHERRRGTTPTKPPRSQSQSPVEHPQQQQQRSRTPKKPPRALTPTRRAPPSPSTAATTVSAIVSGAQTQSHKKAAAAANAVAAVVALERQSVSAHSTDEPLESSESERDSDMAVSVGGGGASCSSAAGVDPKRRHMSRLGLIEDHESTGLVSQESFEDELPYVPTTLPEERAQGVAIIPVKERANMELKTCPVERPRSTTPLNPAHLDEYSTSPAGGGGHGMGDMLGPPVVRGEKLRISLPRKDPTKQLASGVGGGGSGSGGAGSGSGRVSVQQSSKSPRRTSNGSGKSWFEFAEEGLRSNLERKDSSRQILPPPPPPSHRTAANADVDKKQQPLKTATEVGGSIGGGSKGGGGKAITTTVQTTHVAPSTSTQRKLSGHWIDFENIPEKRKPPKRITTLPRETSSGALASASATSAASPSSAGGHARTPNRTHHHEYAPQPDVTVAATSSTDGGKLHYNYVKPEDCQCECHEMKRGSADLTAAVAATTGGASNLSSGANMTTIATATTSTMGGAAANAMSGSTGANKAISSVDLLQQGEDMLPLLDSDTHDGIEPSDSSHEYSCYTDDEMDVPMRQSSSSRSRSSSSKLDEFPRRNVSHSPRNRKFPDHRN